MTPPHATSSSHVRTGESGEGVISTAIAVLIMAIIGGLMWVAFDGVFQTAAERVGSEVENIGG